MISRYGFATLVTAAAIALAGCGGDADSEGAATVADTALPTVSEAAVPVGPEFLDPDAASRDDLMRAGLDSAAAEALIAARPHANMLSVDSALATTMDETARDSVYTRLWKPIDLNNASEAEILLIPGVGSRMQHEFEEYRPYTSMEQFRREIGKYVDEAEVARLERYIAIR